MAKKPAGKPEEGSEVKAEEAKTAKTVETTAPKKEESSKHLGEVVKKEDFILVDLLGKDKASGRAFLATNKNEALKHKDLYDEKARYSPIVIIAGEKGALFDTITEAFEKEDWKVGEERTFDLPPEKAYGKRDGTKIRMMGVREFQKKAGKVAKFGEEIRDPKTGETGHIIRLNQGRATVDFNHQLAGKEVIFTVKVVDKLTEEREIINAFIQKSGLDPAPFKIARKDKDLEVEIPQNYMFIRDLLMFKYQLGMELTRRLKGVDRVRFIETIEKIPEAPPKDEHDHDHKHEHEHDHDHKHEKKEDAAEKPEDQKKKKK